MVLRVMTSMEHVDIKEGKMVDTPVKHDVPADMPITKPRASAFETVADDVLSNIVVCSSSFIIFCDHIFLQFHVSLIRHLEYFDEEFPLDLT